MPRVRKGAARNQARKRLLRSARGYYGPRGNHRAMAKMAVRRAGRYAYRDRRNRKRDMRALWITRITAACRMRGTRYSVFINGLRFTGILLNRKMLSQIAIDDPKTFDVIVTKALKAIPAEKLPATKASAAPQGPEGDIERIEGVGPQYAAKLRGMKLGLIKDYLAACRTPKGRADVAEQSGINDKLILKWANHADLFRIKGVAGQYAELLEASGVDTVKELGHRVAANLAKKMADTNAAKNLTNRVPTEAEVAGWIEQAKTMPAALEY